jgi:HAE1 family hydrophobic/amphiphilic exporter-1/multidrug efflux pump
MTVQSDTRSQLELSDYAENVISQRLETIPGVSGVQIWGQKRYAMRLWIDPIKLASYGLGCRSKNRPRKTERRITFRKIDRS